MRGAIDIGSNSLRFLTIDENQVLIEQKVAETRLGDGFREGSISSGAMSRTLDVLVEWHKELVANGCDDILIFATSAVRDANNQGEFSQLVKNRTGLTLRILTGEEEARYAFAGATGGFDFLKEQCLLIDIGGGSTEIALYQEGELVCCSMPLGAVRWKLMAYSRNTVKKIITKELANLDFKDIKHYISVGGTATTAAAIINEVSDYRRDLIHGKALSVAEIIDLEKRLEAMTLTERYNLKGLTEARADIISFGLAILSILSELLQIDDVIVSDCGILDGILAE